MDVLIDDPYAERQFRQILLQIQQQKNGSIAARMDQPGILYKTNWGVPVADLKEIASGYAASHLLALKLWNKQWRETMILAAMLDVPSEVSEQQMDFWTKSFQNSEIAEQVSAILWCRTAIAYAKALEWCRGKKHWVRYTGVHLTGRLALIDKKSPDEMYEPFFEEFVPLSRDPALSSVIYRTMIILANRSEYLRKMVKEWIIRLKSEDHEYSGKLAGEVSKGINIQD